MVALGAAGSSQLEDVPEVWFGSLDPPDAMTDSLPGELSPQAGETGTLT